MNPENIPLIIALIGGITIGVTAGFIAAGAFQSHKLRRRERETWNQARTYFRHRYGIES
jgi:hypothetical protein